MTGIDCIPTRAAVVRKLLGTTLKNENLQYMTKLKSDGHKKLKIAFYRKSIYDMVFREKRKLKAKTIWLTAYLARQAVKQGHADFTWTTDGCIIMKKKADSRPHVANSITEMMEHLGI